MSMRKPGIVDGGLLLRVFARVSGYALHEREGSIGKAGGFYVDVEGRTV